jgi:hypothetical protein
MVLNSDGGTNMNRNSSLAWSKICAYGQCIAQNQKLPPNRLCSFRDNNRIKITLVREFESKEIRDVIRRMFVMQTKINCSLVLASDLKSLRLDKPRIALPSTAGQELDF